ncbi:aldehyde dehydrogenase [Oculatella sp. LEGE 06141]|uniref:aldehyde dehydrogenase n=1 Tax=Oculatella sp. LEGE 06141 TaxID=1828648 RepID=UPI00187F374B|nr:aldehyde dehydrogenase [Oculatella sp. LEGE 06141]MBE9177108.1 aldehyde dehydrogenase [Oculatella sp. LEGE 06141]
MQVTSAHTATIRDIVAQQRTFFGSGTTKEINFRLSQLTRLRQAVISNQAAILAALKADLHKPEFEAYLTEVGVVQEIDHAIKHLHTWVKPTSVKVSLQQFPGKAKIYAEPLGVVLIISPWNYPFQLMISPLVGAIAAGNCAVLKPSETAPHTSRLLADIIQKTFDPAYVAIVEGGVEISQAILEERFDHIFFTGGTAVGKRVMQAAAKHLTPVTLELGGKSPCIVDADIDLETTARRIVWGKFLNAGQTCIAPDYLLVDRRIKSTLLDRIQATIREFYGDNPADSPDFARIVSPKQFNRLSALLEGANILIGGQTNADDRYIAPTVITPVSLEAPVMQEEIFGPILPVLEYDTVQEAIDLITSKPKPLALYVFSRNKSFQARVLNETSSGNACINDTILQVGVSTLPFGGVGDSGMGSYHGKASFDTFSHRKSVLFKPFWMDLKLRYAPYHDRINLLRRMIK